MTIANRLSDYSNGIPIKDAKKEEKVSQRFYNLGVTAATLSMEKQKLSADKQQFEMSKNELLKSIIAENMKMQQQGMAMQQQAQYQGSMDATKQHLDGYSQQMAGFTDTSAAGNDGFKKFLYLKAIDLSWLINCLPGNISFPQGPF